MPITITLMALVPLALGACVPIAASDPAPDASPTVEPTPVPPTAAPGDFSLDPPTVTPVPSPTPTPDPEPIIGRAIINGTGQSGEELIGEFEPSSPIPPHSAGMTLGVRLWLPKQLPDSRNQPQGAIVHSANARRQGWVEVPTTDGDRVRLYIHPEGRLGLEPYAEDADRITDTFPPDGPAQTYSIVIPFDLLPDGLFTYQFRVSNFGLSPILVHATLELTD
jgi:hypothetical protein